MPLGPVSAIRDAARWLTPFGLMQSRRRAQQQQADRRLNLERRQRLDRLARADASVYDYEASIATLVALGLDEQQVREGSMPEGSLEWVAGHLRDGIDGDSPVMVHVGNFVGVSLTYLTHAMSQLHPDALVISVDPAMTHRDIDRPDGYVHQLLAAVGLRSNSMVITGFSQRANARNDGLSSMNGVTFQKNATGADAASENVLPNLVRLLGPTVHAVVLDGNHDPEYLKAELDPVSRLLRPGGLLVLDDVQEGIWQGIAEVFGDLASTGAFERLEHDGRVGIARRSAT